MFWTRCLRTTSVAAATYSSAVARGKDLAALNQPDTSKQARARATAPRPEIVHGVILGSGSLGAVLRFA